MSVTPHPKFPGAWIIRWYPEGRKKDPKTGKASNKRERLVFEGTYAEAMAQYADLLQSAKKPATTLAPTLEQAWEDFCSYYKNHVSESTYRDYLATWGKHLKPFFGQYRPAHLTQTLVEKYKTLRATQKTVRGDFPTKKTVTKELCYISSMCTWMARPEIGKAKPLSFKIKGYSGRQIKAPLAQVPSRREIILLIRHAEREYRPIFLLCYYGGLRKNEALTLRGENVNFSQGYMIVYGKGGKERIVPIFRKLRVYLRKRYTRGLLFVNPATEKEYVDFRKALKRAADKAGLEQHVYMHLLRHSFGTHSIQSGIGLRTLQILMGHSSSQVTEIYTTLAGQYLGQEIDKFGRGALRQLKRPGKP